MKIIPIGTKRNCQRCFETLKKPQNNFQILFWNLWLANLNRACTKKTVNACHHGSSNVSGASKSDMARLNQVMQFAIICHPILSLEKWFKNYWHFNEAWIDFPNVKIGLHFAQANCTTCAPRVHHVCTNAQSLKAFCYSN